VIAGGASGIGEASAKLLVDNGAKVVIADIAPNASFFHCNVSNEQHVSALLDFAQEKHGRLDIVFSNEGIPGGLFSSMADVTIEDLVISVNVSGAYLCAKNAARVMIATKRVSIFAA